MQTLRSYTFAFLLVVLSICSTACKDENKRESDLLIGTWKNEKGSLCTYNANGTESCFSQVEGFFSTSTRVLSLKWYVKDGYLYETVTASNDPEKFPIGFAAAHKIVSLDKQKLTYIDPYNGQTKTDVRVSSPN